MTRRFGEIVDCEHCGKRTTKENAFSRWYRSHRGAGRILSSAEGNNVCDLDYIIHRSSIRDARGIKDKTVQYLMILEVKTHNSEVTESQRDTLWILDQLLITQERPSKCRNNGRFTGVHNVRNVYSTFNGKRIQIICYGVHRLKMSGTCPASSARMYWDNKLIDIRTLETVLSFELNPYTLMPMQHRQHKAKINGYRELF